MISIFRVSIGQVTVFCSNAYLDGHEMGFLNKCSVFRVGLFCAFLANVPLYNIRNSSCQCTPMQLDDKVTFLWR